MQPGDHDYEHLYKYQVNGTGPTSIGTAEDFWLDKTTGKLEFIGVKTDVLVPHSHVIPAGVVDIDEALRTITVPYGIDFVREAPYFEFQAPITEADRERIYAYYDLAPEG